MKEAIRSAADAGGLVGPDVVAACALSAVPGLGASSIARIAEAFHSLHGALDAGAAAIAERAGELKLKPEAREYLSQSPDLAELGLWAVGAAKGAGARVILLGDDWYPPRLREIPNPPALLYVRGHLAPEARRVAIVGSRQADEQGMEIARSLGDAFARAGVTVVSGGARGIDTAAHDGAFWGSGPSVAVMGSGIDVVYPPENAEMFDRIARGAGAVVSEFAPGTQPKRENFPRRNRTVAGLADAVVLVRAAMKSGALITADHAAQQGKPLFAVPGDLGQPLAAGPNELLRLGVAQPATSAIDVLEAMHWPVPDVLLQPPPDDAERQIDPGFPASKETPEKTSTDEQVVDEESLRLWQLLDERTPAHVDDLARRAELHPQQALRKLAELESKGMCVQRPGKYFLRR
ncbi:MAG TPA: DNA-processing protein DprA [Myxococcales bacterium]|nr:DNA-processing protein DprA [Myxococcales bacterium]